MINDFIYCFFLIGNQWQYIKVGTFYLWSKLMDNFYTVLLYSVKYLLYNDII